MTQLRLLSVFIAALSLPFAVQPSAADEHGRGHPNAGQFRNSHGGNRQGFRGGNIRHFRGGDIRRFRDHDIGVWHGGRWYHGPHGGHRGWWWIAGGNWYFYPGPVYPYPDPYLPAMIDAPLAPGYWYYCDNPPGYYPYVAQCFTPWHAVAPGDAAPPQ